MDEKNPKDAQSFNKVEEQHLGPILGVLLIILVLILGGLYLWGASLSKAPMDTPVTPVVTDPEPTAEDPDAVMGTVSTSNSLEAIEADLSATDLENIDSDLDIVAGEIESGLQSQ